MAKLVTDQDANKIYDLLNTLLGTDYKFTGFGADMPVATGLFHEVITLFNFHAKSGKWYPTVVENAHIVAAKSRTHSTEGMNNADTVRVQITSNVAQNVSTPEGNKSYTTAKEYAATDSPADYITFTPECDFFLVGKYDDLNPVDDDDFDEGFYSAMNADNDGVYMISSAVYYGLLPHFEIGGR